VGVHVTCQQNIGHAFAQPGQRHVRATNPIFALHAGELKGMMRNENPDAFAPHSLKIRRARTTCSTLMRPSLKLLLTLSTVTISGVMTR
jgi:hypothetical protein